MSSTDFSPSVQNDLTAGIANGSTSSAVIDLKGTQLCGLHMLAAFTGTSLKLLTAPTSAGPFQPVQSAGADYVLTVAASKYVPIENLAVIAGLRFIQLQSGSTEAGDRVIPLATRPL